MSLLGTVTEWQNRGTTPERPLSTFRNWHRNSSVKVSERAASPNYCPLAPPVRGRASAAASCESSRRRPLHFSRGGAGFLLEYDGLEWRVGGGGERFSPSLFYKYFFYSFFFYNLNSPFFLSSLGRGHRVPVQVIFGATEISRFHREEKKPVIFQDVFVFFCCCCCFFKQVNKLRLHCGIDEGVISKNNNEPIPKQLTPKRREKKINQNLTPCR